jgi:enoyl-CoA hydratase/carnithine racemase
MAEVEVARDGAVQTITLNRPDVLNAFNRALHKALREALKEARDPEVRAVVLTGAGRGFSAGQDLKEFGEAPDVGDALRESYHPNVLAIRALEKPVIAAVNGVCAGAGLSLACVCDVRIAAESASFGQPEINLGIIPGFGGTQRLPRLVGTARALELNLTGDPISAAEAHAIGLVNQVVPDHELFDVTLAWARKLGGQAPLAVGAIKRTTAGDADLDEGIEAEKAAFAEVFQSADAREGIGAFLGKRQPSWKGE